MRVSGIKSKLLLAFVTILFIMTGLNVGLAIYLTNQQSEREAFTSLTRQTILLQNDLQKATLDLRAIAQKTAGGTDNLSDLATIYAQTQQIITNSRQPAEYERVLVFNKVISLNRLQVVLRSAGFSSIAVYVDNELSHYVTTAEAGMSVFRAGHKALIKTGQNQAGELEFDNWPNWAEGDLPSSITSQVTPVNRPTISFYFTPEQRMVLQIVIPIQAVTQTVMRNNITLGNPAGLLVNQLSIATSETLNQSAPGQNKPVIIGAFVFQKVFDQAFLEEVASKTGLLPALYSPDGLRQIQIVDLKINPADLGQWARENQAVIDQRILAVDRESYYQTLSLWQFEEKPQLIIGFAQSAASTSQKVRETVTGLVGVAGLVLVVGGVVGYLLFDRLVNPIRALTAAVSRIGLSVQQESPDRPVTPVASDKLVEIDLRADDEVQQLTAAFNAMIRQLRQSFETLEERVAHRTAELEAVNKDLEAFSYSVSHDLRAPLRAVSGFAAILARRHRANLNDEGQHYLDNIVQAGEQMGRLIDDLLTYSRLGRSSVHRGPVALREIFTLLAEEFAGRVKEIGGRLEIADDLPVVMGDKTLLTQIFTNLLDNALTYRRADVPAQVTVTHQTEDKMVIVRVSDNGIGIAPEYQEKIFNIFQRLHSQEEYPGTGIGLATVKRSVEMLGGRLWVESKVGQGSAFFVKLPKE
ncbi:MAG: hypothetical protein Fur0044_26730 [Anaerolineae bacterium]|nr:HAMP domain-containing protein [Anaerolineales bacterium]MCQ3979549.1 hypothetical protein [Anaerolineae bacterium]